MRSQTALVGLSRYPAHGYLWRFCAAWNRLTAHALKLTIRSHPMPTDVALLRSPDSPDAYIQAFEQAGLQASCVPVLSFRFPNQEALVEQLQAAGSRSGLILTSPRAAAALKQAFENEPGHRVLWNDKAVFVVGPKTAEAVRDIGLTPQGQTAGDAAALVESIGAAWDQQCLQLPLLFLSGTRRRDTLPNGLAKTGIPVIEQVVYETKPRSDVQIDSDTRWLAFFSPSGLEAVEASRVMLTHFRIAAIGPTTGQALSDAGMPPEAIAEHPTPSALVDAVKSAEKER